MKKIILCFMVGLLSVVVISCGDNKDGAGAASTLTIKGSGQ